MPFYKFKCINCKAEEKKLMEPETLKQFCGACIVCGAALQQILGTAEARSLVTKDEYHDKKQVDGLDKMILDRANEHYETHDKPRNTDKDSE